jgi:hypothetical protein
VNYAQIICKEVKKVFRKRSHTHKKCHANDLSWKCCRHFGDMSSRHVP